MDGGGAVVDDRFTDKINDRRVCEGWVSLALHDLILEVGFHDSQHLCFIDLDLFFVAFHAISGTVSHD